MLLLLIGFVTAVSACLFFILPLYLQGSLHFTGGQIGLLYGVLSLNAILVSFPVGVTGDRYPARVLTQLGLAGMAVSLWCLASLSRFWPFLAAFLGFGLSMQIFRQSLDILLYKENPGGRARSFGHFNAARMGGGMAGLLVGGFLFHLLDFPVTLKIFAVWMLLLLLPTGWLPLTPGVRAPLFEYRRDFLTRPVLFLAAWLLLFALHWGAETTSLGLFLQHNLDLGSQGVGVYMAGEFAVITFTVYLYGTLWAGRLKPLTFLSVALLTSGVGHILMTYPSLPWSFFWRAAHGFGDGLILMETYTTISRLFRVERIGGNSSLITLTTTLGSFAGSLLFGPLGAAWGYQFPLIISGAISLALLPVAYWGLRE